MHKVSICALAANSGRFNGSAGAFGFCTGSRMDVGLYLKSHLHFMLQEERCRIVMWVESTLSGATSGSLLADL